MHKDVKKFLYLVQGRGELPEVYSTIENAQADIIRLSWKEKIDGAIYFPNSTWTQGRNRLLEEARKRETPYLYYIFLDDDIVFEKGDWRTFEECLVKYEPAAATPFCSWYPPNKNSLLELEAHTCFMFDAMFNAFHRDIVNDDLVLPYYTGFDHKSWWYSQWFVIHLMHAFFPKHVLQFNGVWVGNSAHGIYPQSAEFDEGHSWLEREVLKPKPAPLLPFNLYERVAWRVQRKLLRRNPTPTPFREPSKKLRSYCISARQRARKVHSDSSYWTRT